MAGVTDTERGHLKNLFDHIDTDHDGKISAADLKSLAHELGREMTDDRAKVRFFVHLSASENFRYL